MAAMAQATKADGGARPATPADDCELARLSRWRRPALLVSPAAAVAAVTVVAIALRWPTLMGPSFWVDEWVTRNLVSLPLLDMLRGVRETESTPPLYYVLGWGWAHIFGTSEFALRSLSALFGAAMVPVTYAAASALATRRVGLIAASFVAFNPLLVWYSTEARAYALLLLLVATTLLFFARALAKPRAQPLLLWSLAGAAALTTHYFAVFVVAAEALALLFVRRSHRRAVALALVPIAAIGLALLPLGYWQRDNPAWIEDLALVGRLLEVPRDFAVGVSEPSEGLVVVVGLLVGAALLLLVRADRRERHAAAIALAVGALSLALPMAVAVVRDYLLARNLLVSWLPLALLVAVGCGVRRAGAAGVAVAAGLCGAWLAVIINVASDERLQRADWKQAGRLIGDAPRDRLVLAWSDWGASPLGDELARARRVGQGESARVAEVVLLGADRPPGRSCWSGAACNITDAPLAGAISLPGFALVDRRRSGLFEVLRFRTRRPVRLSWETVSKVEPASVPAVWLQRRSVRAGAGG